MSSVHDVNNTNNNSNNNCETSEPFPFKVRPFDGHDWFSTKIYRRNLPHWELKGSTYFITIRVDSKVGKPFAIREIATTMQSILYSEEKKKYILLAYVIMPDHLHLILKPINGNSLAKIMQTMKGSAAYAINKMLKRTGKFWQTENFDHLIRNDSSLGEKWEYIRSNPLKARLVKEPEQYPYSSFYEK